MRSIVFKPTTSAVIARFTTAAILLLALAACYVDGDPIKDKIITFKPIVLAAIGVDQGVDISWNAVYGATSYTVYYHTASFNQTSDNGVESKTGITATNTSITGLTNGTKYYLRVESINANNGDKGLSVEITVTANLQAPTKLQATGGDKIVDISWSAVTGATSYKVYYSKASFSSASDSRVTSIIGITATNASITGLTAGTKYYLRVEVINADGDKKLSKVVTATTKATATANLQPPTNVKATGGDKIVDINWSAVTGATSYKVYYHTASFTSTAGVLFKTVQSPALSTIITGLTDDTTYYFGVIASNASVSSALSQIQSATTKLNLPPPTGIIATGKDKAIDLIWDAVAGATSYKVYYSTASFSSATESGVQSKNSVTTTSTIITGLVADTKYYLRVEAINAQGNNGLSAEVTAATKLNLQAPINVIATAGDKIVDISWSAVTGATSYKVYYHTASFTSTAGVLFETVQSPALSTIITGLTAGTKYYLRVAAINAYGESNLSGQVSVIALTTTKLSALHPSAAASIVSPAAVDLSWDALAGVTVYKIYYAKDSLDGLHGGYKNYASVGGKVEVTTATSVTISDLSADTTYYFVVVANYNNGEKAAPEVSADSSYIAELAMGGGHGCIRLNTGGIKCWGYNRDGRLGVGDRTDRHTATSVPGMLAKQLSTGDTHNCAIDLSDSLYCWGWNRYSQLGLSSGSRSSPTRVDQAKLAKVSLVTAGITSTCALAGGKNYCWGDQYRGGLGNGASSGKTPIAQEIKNITPDVRQFALGKYSGCAIDASDDLWCWGYNKYGQIGNGKNNDQLSLVKLTLQGSSTATMLGGIYKHYCVVDKAKKIQCWGWNSSGHLGIDSTADSNRPQYVLASPKKSDYLSNVNKIAIARYHSCALITGGKVRCWGVGTNGRIGTAGGARRLVANVDMSDIGNAIDIAAGNTFTCVLLADRARVKCWGGNDWGQLGNGTTSNSHTPVEVLGL